MPHRQEKDRINPRLVLAWICWLRLCGVRTRAERTVPQAFHRNADVTSNKTMTASLLSLSNLLFVYQPNIQYFIGINLLIAGVHK